MPMESQAQRGYLWANHPDVAKKFEAETPKGESLPQHVGQPSLRESVNIEVRKRLQKGGAHG